MQMKTQGTYEVYIQQVFGHEKNGIHLVALLKSELLPRLE